MISLIKGGWVYILFSELFALHERFLVKLPVAVSCLVIFFHCPSEPLTSPWLTVLPSPPLEAQDGEGLFVFKALNEKGAGSCQEMET